MKIIGALFIKMATNKNNNKVKKCANLEKVLLPRITSYEYSHRKTDRRKGQT